MSRIWWTQPRLSLVACLIYAAAYTGMVLVVDGPGGRSLAAAMIALAVTAAYRAVSRRLARAHEIGATDAAFERAVWRARWRTPPLFGGSDLASAVAMAMAPQDRPRGRIVLFGADDVKAPLRNALQSVEAARLAVPANWRIQAASLATGALAPWLAWPSQLGVAAAGGLLMPLAATWLLTGMVDRQASMFLLRSGSVERVAQLRARTFRDVLGGGVAVAVLALTSIFCGLIVLWAWTDWANDRPHALLNLASVGLLVAAIASARYALRAIPLVRFRGPAVISAYVDQELRQSRIYVLIGLSGQLVLGFRHLWVPSGDFLGGLGPVLVVVVFTATFAWRPDALGQRGRHGLPGRLRRIQRRWGLVDVPESPGSTTDSTGVSGATAAGSSTA